MAAEQSNRSQNLTKTQKTSFDNRALSQEARYEPAAVIPLKRGGSLLEWLEGNGRLVLREKKESSRSGKDNNEEELAGLIEEDDRDYVDDEDDEESDD